MTLGFQLNSYNCMIAMSDKGYEAVFGSTLIGFFDTFHDAFIALLAFARSQ